jgi:ABC-2 type transport system permease protein
MLSILKLRLLRLKEEYKILLAMVGMSLVLTFVFGGAGTSVARPLVVLSPAEAASTEVLADELEALGSYRVSRVSREEGETSLEKGEAMAHLVIPGDFEEKLRRGEPALSLTSTKSDLETGALLRQIESILSRRVERETVRDLLLTTYPEAGEGAVERALEQGLARSDVLTTRMSIADTGQRTAYVAETMIGFTVMFAAFTLVFGIGELITEKKQGTYWRLVISPLSRLQIILGNASATILIGLVQMAVVFGVGVWFFRLPFADHLAGLLVFSLLYVSAMVAYGLFFSTFLKTPGQLGAFSPLILTAMAMIGGCLWPLEIVRSRVLLALSTLTPHRWALEGMRGLVVADKGVGDLLLPLGVLVAMSIIAAVAGAYRIGRETPGH